MPVTRSEILRLYKNLMLYSKNLTLTDPKYFRQRITTEFRKNKVLTDGESINFAYKAQATVPAASKHTIDYSKVPKIHEYDLEEKFVRGSGPGGSAVNKNSNCVVLTHIPSGMVVKCHTSRCQDENRKIAREQLIAKLDEELNGEDSVAAQRKKLEEKKSKRNDYKRKKKAEMKSEWKKREGLL